VVVVFIANEENSDIIDIGVDGLVKNGKIAHLKKGYEFFYGCVFRVVLFLCSFMLFALHLFKFPFASPFSPVATCIGLMLLIPTLASERRR
jgi:hypothetical protein